MTAEKSGGAYVHFKEVGQQLRAYRMESGLKAEEIAARLGVSRAALYRYEKGEVIKLDTVNRLAELLKISPLTLLGIGVEYYTRPIGYAERLRQIEETSDQILQFFGPLCYPVTSEHYDAALAQMFQYYTQTHGDDGAVIHAAAEQLRGIMLTRKQMYQTRRPSIICVVTLSSLHHLLRFGIAGALPVSEKLRTLARKVAFYEVEQIATLMAREPIGLQLGLMTNAMPNGPFMVLRSRERALLVANPFPPDAAPDAQSGVAMISSADDGVATHQRVSEQIWREALKGPAAAQQVRELLAMMKE